MGKTTRRMIVTLRAAAAPDRMDPEDAGLAGDWGLTLTGRLAARPDPAEAALDVFHQVVPIGRLDDFEITVREELGRMRRLRPIDLALVRCREGAERSVAGSSSETTRRGPYVSRPC